MTHKDRKSPAKQAVHMHFVARSVLISQFPFYIDLVVTFHEEVGSSATDSNQKSSSTIVNVQDNETPSQTRENEEGIKNRLCCRRGGRGSNTRIRRLNPILSYFNVRRANIVKGARDTLKVKNDRDQNNPGDPNSLHPTTSHQAVKDRLNNILLSESSVTLDKFYCQIFWLTMLYVGLYGSILAFVAYYTFCTVKCKCPVALDVQVI